MATPNIVSSDATLILDLPPSCIQFCTAHPSFFVVGTYNLQKEEAETDKQDDGHDGHDDGEQGNPAVAKTPQSRNGSLLVYRVGGNSDL